MKSIILAVAMLSSFDASGFNCSTATLTGGALPTRVDGSRANHQEMTAKREETVAYIGHLERIIEECRPDGWSEAELVRSMELAAKRFNRALHLYNDRARVARR